MPPSPLNRRRCRRDAGPLPAPLPLDPAEGRPGHHRLPSHSARSGTPDLGRRAATASPPTRFSGGEGAAVARPPRRGGCRTKDDKEGRRGKAARRRHTHPRASAHTGEGACTGGAAFLFSGDGVRRLGFSPTPGGMGFCPSDVGARSSDQNPKIGRPALASPNLAHVEVRVGTLPPPRPRLRPGEVGSARMCA